MATDDCGMLHSVGTSLEFFHINKRSHDLVINSAAPGAKTHFSLWYEIWPPMMTLISLSHNRSSRARWKWVKHQLYSPWILSIFEKEVKNSSVDISTEIITPLQIQHSEQTSDDLFLCEFTLKHSGLTKAEVWEIKDKCWIHLKETWFMLSSKIVGSSQNCISKVLNLTHFSLKGLRHFCLMRLMGMLKKNIMWQKIWLKA